MILLIADAPFGPNVKVSNWDISTGLDQLEVSMAKSPSWIAVHWIDLDWSGWYSANDFALSSDGGATWNFIWYIRPPDTISCWIGDPSVASDPSNPNQFYAVGMIYCNPYDTKGEIYFCKNSGSPDNAANWSCSLLPPNDGWAYFKDKPWIIALGGGVILVNYTTDKYGNYEIDIARSTNYGSTWNTIRMTDVVSTVAYFYKDGSTLYLSQNNFNSWPTAIAIRVKKSTDNGATWTSLGDAVSFSPGSSTACPNFNRPAKIHNNITAQGNNIAVSFIKPNGSYCNVGIAYSTNGGSTWNNKYVAQTSTDQILPMVASSSPSNLYVMWQEKVGSQWATKWASSTNWATTFSAPGRVSDHNYTLNENPAGHDYNGFIYEGGTLFAIWADDYYGDDAGAVYFTKTTSSSVEENGKFENLGNYEIYSVDGKLVKGNLKDLPKGVYFLKEGRRVVKVIK